MNGKILYITTQDKFFLSHLKDRAIYASKHGFMVFVAAQKTDENFVREINELGFDFFDTGIERQALNPIAQLKALIRLREIINIIKPDISHHLGAKSIIYGTIAHKLSTISNVGSIINAPIGLGYVFAAKELKAKILKPLVSLLYQLTLNPLNSYVIFENTDDLNYFADRGALDLKRAVCIYGAGVDTELFSPSVSNAKNEICTVVMASRLIKEKGVFDFIRAAEILTENSVPVRMQLVGEPDYGNPNSLTKQQFEDLKNNTAIECLGYRADMSCILKKAHICCLPSFYREGLPRFLIEGVCSGLAIVTTDTVGCREVVVDKNGFLIKPHDVNSLVNAIKTLVDNPTLTMEMGNRSRNLALKFFDKNLICQQTLDVYQEALRQKYH